jgi:hypothetical protein
MTEHHNPRGHTMREICPADRDDDQQRVQDVLDLPAEDVNRALFGAAFALAFEAADATREDTP